MNTSTITDQDHSSFNDIDNYIEQQRCRYKIPGISLAIVEGDRIVHFRGFGRARPGGEAPTLQTPFFIGSVTKSFTALAIMQLVEAEKVELEAPIQRYLPWFKVADQGASKRITVQHLLNHISGLSMLQGQIVLSNLDDDRYANERQIKSLSKARLSSIPGTKFEYNNTNYNILGLIIESVSGEMYSSYIQNHIFNPLKMTHSYTSRNLARMNGLAMGYRYWFAIPIPSPNLRIPLGSLPSGQLISSAEDMTHYLIAQLNRGHYDDERVLSSAGIEAMHQGVVDMLVFGKSYGTYGMGWEIHRKDHTTIVSHSGIVPDFGGFAAIIPDQKKGIILLYNANHAMMKLTFDELGLSAAERLAGLVPSKTMQNVAQWLMRSLLLIPILQATGTLLSLDQLNSRNKKIQHYSPPAKDISIRTVLPEIPNIFAAIMAIPMLTKMRGWLKLFMPDYSLIATICGGFAVAWIFFRMVIGTLKSRNTR